MKKFFMNTNVDQRGYTLIELLVSFVLITLLLTTFLMMFAQAAKTNISSEKIVDSTYIAQTEMEKIYGLSKRLSSNNKSIAFPNDQYHSPEQKIVEGKNWVQYKKKNNPPGADITIRIEDTTNEMTRIIIEVYEKSKANPSAKMENVLIWEGTP